MPDFIRTSLVLMLAGALAISSLSAHAKDHYTLEKVVEVSRHGIRPPSPADRKVIEAGSARLWPVWITSDGELTGHGYTAVWLKGRYESQRYRHLGLLKNGCPASGEFYVRASPMQRTRATAAALTEAAFPGCGIAVHSQEKSDPLFRYPEGKVARDSAEVNRQQALKALGGNLAEAQKRLQPHIDVLKEAVCQPDHPCPAFSQPWQLTVWSNGTIGMKGLDTLAAMAETIRLAWSEGQPLNQVAFGHARTADEVARLLPLLSVKYTDTNDLPGPAQRGASLLMDQIAKALQQGVSDQPDAPPDVRWLLYVAHDINIAWLRTLLDFHWQQDRYPAGNIPPGGSLVFERWRDEHQRRFICIYFQAQSLDQLRHLSPLSQSHPPLLTEFRFRGCKETVAGTLCPYDTSMQRIEMNIDRSLIIAVSYAP